MTRAHTPRKRDSGLNRISALTRWTVAGALAGTGVFAGLAAHAGKGGAGTTNQTAATRRTTTAPSSDDGSSSFSSDDDSSTWQGGSQSATPLQPIVVQPSTSSGPATAVSGAS